MRLFAISDLHLDYRENRVALSEMPDFPDDWLILAGDICSSMEHFKFALEHLTDRFAKVIWVPGNHELWCDSKKKELNSNLKYSQLVEICNNFDVLTPEDPYLEWNGEGGQHLIVPLFLLYDYSFRPDHVEEHQAVAWARESGILCNDESLIKPHPFPDFSSWCRARCDYATDRLNSLPAEIPTILINHHPLREELVRLKRIPRFSIWCGTKETENWHRTYNAAAVVSGHLHLRATDYRDQVRFEEVSLGYPKHWRREHGMKHYLRQILPHPEPIPREDTGPIWRF